MLELQEAIRQTQLKLELLERKEKLESENKLLDAEIRKLKIIAHNEQADVENMQMPSIRGLLLGITGKKQEILEKEQAEARNAQQNYEFAVTRQESILHKLSQCTEQLVALGACEEKLRQMLSLPEDPSLAILIRCSECTPHIQKQISDMLAELAKVSQLGAFRNGTQSTSALAGTDDKLLAAERKAQNMLIQLKADIKSYAVSLAPFGIVVNSDALQSVTDDYLTDLYTYALITSRVEKITIMLRQIGFQMDAIKPKIAQLTSEKNKKYLRTLLDAARNN